MTASTDFPASIGKYRLIASLGQGGMARVFLGMAQGPGGFSKLMVVKVMRPELGEDADFRGMFMAEARIAARLNHTNVVHTYDVGEEGPYCYLAMDYLEGQTLHGLIGRVGRSGVPLDLMVWVVSQMLAGLHYAHELTDFDGSPMKVVHRDVSPHNVFVTYDGAVKLLDFGIAKVAGAASNTHTGQFKGKLSYAAPEQMAGKSLDRRADIFAAGVMLWEALARRRLTQGESDVAIYASRLRGEFPDPRQHNPEAPLELVEICKKAMAASPDDRFSTAAELQAALERYLEATGKPSWSKDLTALLTTNFASDREKIRGQVEAQVKKAAQESPSRPLSVVVLGEGTSASQPSSTQPRPPASDSRPPLSSVTAVSPATSTVPSPVAPSPKGKTALVAAVAALGLLAVGVGYLSRKDPSPVAASSTVAPLAPNGANAANAPAASASAAPSASAPGPGDGEGAKGERVSVQISASPDEAEIALDGVKVAGNPFRAHVKRDDAPHRLTVSLQGYQREERMVVFDRDVSLEVPLRKTKGGAEPAAKGSPPTAAGAPAQAGAPAATGADTTKPPPKPKRAIDDSNPYAQ